MTTMRNDAQLLLLDKNAVERLLTMDDVMPAVARAFALHHAGEGRVFPVIREPLQTGGVFGIKAGDVQSAALLGFKAAGFWPANRNVGGEPHQATIMLVDPTTGRPRCIIDGNAITTMRTGAAGALGLQMLARPDSTRLCVFGTGVQACIQTRFALSVLPGITSIRYVSHTGQSNLTFEALFQDRCEVVLSTDANAAVAASDIVITATPGRGALFDADAVQPGTHINAVGADTKGKRELPEGLLQQARRIVDDRIQAQQIGELQWAPTLSCVELGEYLANASAAGPSGTLSRATDDITLFDMTGLALQDLTVAEMLVERATAQDVGTLVPWAW